MKQKALRAGSWAAISREIGMSLDKIVTDAEPLIGLVTKVCKRWSEATVMVFAADDGEYVGCDTVDLKYLTRIRRPEVVKSVALLPVARIEIHPGFIDRETGEMFDSCNSDKVCIKKLNKQLARINRAIASLQHIASIKVG